MNQPPIRSCISCRRSAPKGQLLRFVVSPEGTVIADIIDRLPGRGAYTCLNPSCVSTAVNRRQFNRAFSSEVNCQSDVFVDDIRQLISKRLLSLLSMANKAGVVISGSDAVERTLSLSSVDGLLWMATDASLERRKKFAFLGDRSGCTVYTGLTSNELGVAIGKDQRSFLLLKA